jgi:hypothetical protein
MHIFSSKSGEPNKRSLHLEAWDTAERPDPVAGRKPKYSWHCDDEEIELLLAFLSDHAARVDGSSYRVVEVGGDLSEIFQLLANASTGSANLVALIEEFGTAPEFVEAMSRSDMASMVMHTVEIVRRKEQLDSLRRVVHNPSSNEHDLHRELKGQTWIFGGKYVGESIRREFTTRSTVDIPLIRGDGSLHVVELKQATIPRLIEPYRSAGSVVGAEINKGVGQLQNYLRDLDENRSTILTEHGVDCRRSSATLLIGDSARVPGFSAKAVREMASATP